MNTSPTFCENCGSPLSPDGTCPVCLLAEPAPRPPAAPVPDAPPPAAPPAEICPSCGKTLVDGVCPAGCTIVRCPHCDAIVCEGRCPNGCTSDPLTYGWPGAFSPPLSDFALEVVAPEEYHGFRCAVPRDFVIGRSSRYAKEPFVELLLLDPRRKSSCSRRYVRLRLPEAADAFHVTLLQTSDNPAWVAGTRLEKPGDAAEFGVGDLMRLSPDFVIRLVRP